MTKPTSMTRLYTTADLGADAPCALPWGLKGIGGSQGLRGGREGGLKDAGLDAALKLSISISVNLGPRILHAETVAVAALAVT